MPDNYNVDDILDEIKRKKSGASHLVPSPERSRAEAPVYSRYDEEDRVPPSRRYDEDYDEEPAPRRTRDPYEERYVPRRRAEDWEEDYAPPRRREVYEEEYAPRRRREVYEEDYAPRRAARYEYEEDYAPPRRRREAYEEGYAPRRRAADWEEDYAPRRDLYEEDYVPRRAERRDEEPAPRRMRDPYDQPPRRSEDWEELPPRERRREPRPEDDLSILRERIAQPEEPPRSRFAAEEDGEPGDRQDLSATGILTDRADILRNFGRGRARTGEPAENFAASFSSIKAGRRLEEPEERTASRTRHIAFGEPPEPPTPEDYTATQMNIQLYAMDDEGHAPIDEQPERRRRGGEDEKEQPRKRRSLFAKRDSTADEQIEEDVDDFNTPKDANQVYRDIKSIKTGLIVRLGVTAVLTAALIYLGFALTNLSLPLLAFMLPEDNMQAFMAVNFGLLLVAVLVCSPTVGGGILSLFKMKANSDSPIAIAALAALGQGAALVAFPEAVGQSGTHFYFAVVSLGLLFNNLGKMFMILRIERNFQLLATGGYQRHAFNIISDRNLARELTRNQDIETPVVGYSHPADFLTNFLHLSYTEDYGENISRITTPLFLLFAVITSGITQYLYGDVFASLTAFVAMTAICAPITTTIVGNLPLRRMNKALVEDGSMVAGYTALDRFDDINCLVLKDSELFGPASITLHGIKAFDEKRIDEAMIDAASVVCKSECVLNAIFTQMIGGNERILKKADSIVYEDSMGISAWVDGKRVLIGNRTLMQNHNIEVPTRDYERKFLRDGRELLYISNSGDLTAMFVLSYNADPDIADELAVLASRGIGISVYTTDSNITPQKISEVFDFPEDMVEIVPYKLHSQCDRLLDPKERAKAEIVYNGSLASKVRTLSAIISAKTSIVLGTILQSVGMVAGYGLLSYFAFTNAIESVSFGLLIAYQCFWALIVMLLPNLRRY